MKYGTNEPLTTPRKTEPEPLRNFTLEQLKDFNGLNGDHDDDENQPIYISIDGIVFDVSSARKLYGKDGNYHIFAGHDATLCLATNSLDESDLDKFCLSNLTHGERDALYNWQTQFRYYKNYPIVGKLVSAPAPDPLPTFRKDDLEKDHGEPKISSTEVFVPPIHVVVNGKVYDVSYGGAPHYAKNMSYNLFVGKDASRALAKMSFDQSNLENPSIKDLSESELEVLNDWDKRFQKKGYRVVGLFPTC
eukprot:CAMPEP_0171459792 /NCGR_PEP_ID=MMETSP0945-20130129/4925_1 /TAXON_ID=109269 /ORGANISM="Vaucheria litorea, Strain CCMP2940" /LENGTH=247 /DNA_ID=CAMNT_0011985863 /DNA_START=121 /DNA_END=864 /DNA_ORIENTATION=+